MSSSTGQAPGAQRPLVVGFDLDMTLIDARAGIRAAWLALSRETGVPVDADLVVTRLGPPVETEVANWFPSEDVERVAARYRAIYAEVGATGVVAMPGAESALAAVRAQHGSIVAVTAKHQPNARLNVAHLGLDLDEVIGDQWAEAKGHALAQRGGSIYIGDHVHDVLGALTAGATAVAVATGPCSRADLEAAGADVVLDSLLDFPAWLDAHLLDVRAASLLERLTALDSVMVAFSGGADSALLLAAAVRALGPARVVAATAYSDSLPRSERGPGAEFAAALGVRLVTPDTHEMAREGYRANGGDRCYFCKAELLDVLRPLADDLGIAEVATGTNADDAVADFRPGIRAAAERGAVTPLRDAGLTKAQVRELSRRWELPTWDKPAAACLSSRIAYGIEVSPHRLARVERAEAAVREALRAAGIEIGDLRVRDLDDRARIEVDASAVESVRVCRPALAAVRAAGFDGVDIEVLAFRSGSMNSLLEPSPARG
jgi:uncharacterized protein